MANHPSAEKRHRQSLKRRERNAARRSRVHKAERKLLEALEAKDSGLIKEILPRTISEIMQAATKGVLHRKTASRKVSRLSRSSHQVLNPS